MAACDRLVFFSRMWLTFCLFPSTRREGRRGGGLLSHFLCAVAEPPPLDAPPGTKPTRFLTFTKLGSGYTMEKLREKNRQLRPHMRKVDTSRDDWPCGMGPNIMLAMPGYKEKPDVWIEPEKSILVEVQAAQITRSEKFAVGYTLRFPRVRRFREDKEWWQCDTTYNVIETAGAATGGNLASGTIEAHHFDVEQKQRKKGGVAASRATVPLTLKKIDVSHVQKKYVGMTRRRWGGRRTIGWGRSNQVWRLLFPDQKSSKTCILSSIFKRKRPSG